MAPTEIVLFKGGEELPGYMLRAGDTVQETYYDHAAQKIEVYVDKSPSVWRIIWERLSGRRLR